MNKILRNKFKQYRQERQGNVELYPCRISDKGTILIPFKFRQKYNLDKGDLLLIQDKDDKLGIIRLDQICE